MLIYKIRQYESMYVPSVDTGLINPILEEINDFYRGRKMYLMPPGEPDKKSQEIMRRIRDQKKQEKQKQRDKRGHNTATSITDKISDFLTGN